MPFRHHTACRAISITVLALVASCAASHQPATNAMPQETPDRATCAAITDSMSKVPTGRLPGATLAQTPQLTSYPSDAARSGNKVRVTFRVAPDGSIAAGSVRITGSTDGNFISAMRDALQATTARPAMVRGCPTWSRGEIGLTSRVVGR